MQCPLAYFASSCSVITATLSTRAAPRFGHALRKRRSARTLCAPQALRTRVSAPHTRAHCPLACVASSYPVINNAAVQPSSATHWGIGCIESRVRVRTLRTPVPTACTTAVTGFPLTPPRFIYRCPSRPQKKNSEVARRHPDGLGTEHNTQSFSGC